MLDKTTTKIKSFLIFSFLFAVHGVLFSQYQKYEMRAVWVATVGNIDWPSKPGLSSERQKQEMENILERMKDYKLNTIIFQIRPAADAFYKSSLEPWSQWLSGKQGQPSDPYYDPLEFLIEQCRKRGIDVHVWLNPYRAKTDTINQVDSTHITNLHPEWFLTYGKTVYFDPGLPRTREYFTSVVSDIVRRYDIDAIHMDDYFYPYRIAGKEFPDERSFNDFHGDFPPDKKDDWRRDNVNQIIRQMHDSIRAIKPWVQFGISPFGVWRNMDKDPEGSATRAGQTNYDDLYADILLWQKNGWIDYIVPQVYWHIGFKVADYAVLADWWSRNTYGCRLYIGQAPYRIDRKSSTREWRNSNEIIRQVRLNRTYPEVSGSAFFSARVLSENPLRLEQRLTRKLYKYPALVPSNNRIEPIMPEPPVNAFISRNGNDVSFSWEKGSNTKEFVIYRFRKGSEANLSSQHCIYRVTSDTTFSIKADREEDSKYRFYITSVSYTNAESHPQLFIQGN
ncbi:MAG TPA: family 10 glycosylhydrolase [Bacteroidales bacterium]|nr:family 10 glycosylhydrolase [Bacteroidales bacterium]